MSIDVRLRRWSPADAEWYAEQVLEDEIQRWTIERRDRSAQDVRSAIERLTPDALSWVIVEAASGERLGDAAVEMLDEVASATYWVAKQARNRGVATAALRAMVERCAAYGARRVELEIHADNVASHRVAEKVGFRHAGSSNHPVLGPCVRYRMALAGGGSGA